MLSNEIPSVELESKCCLGTLGIDDMVAMIVSMSDICLALVSDVDLMSSLLFRHGVMKFGVAGDNGGQEFDCVILR